MPDGSAQPAGHTEHPAPPRGRKRLMVQPGKLAEVITESISPREHQQVPWVGGSREFHLEISLACGCLAAEQAACPAPPAGTCGQGLPCS